MKAMTTAQLRQAYLDFFERKDHSIIAGASLVPENDPTVLFTTAGMHPLVPYLLGEPHPSGARLADVQLCVRTQDIDEVGDASHLTCFEMLGNWSLGDYFKQDAIWMSFEYLTNVLGIPLDHLAVTCFEGDKDAPRDNESAEIWEKLGMPKERIAFLPKAKNWWGPAGVTGPCGPDTEIFYWVGKGTPIGNPKSHEHEWLEIWNNVFMQYFKNDDGTFQPLLQRNVDTGMGLERVAAVMQNVPSVYDTDAFKPIMDKVEALAQTPNVRHLRIITDHLKAAVFLIADGVEPSNIDQGYVLRRLIRRAVRSARMVGIDQSEVFTPKIAEVVIIQYGSHYTHIEKNKSIILDALTKEEGQFKKTLEEGLRRFNKVLKTIQGKTIDGVIAFHLYDTYGFPIELTKELAAEHGLSVDDAGYKQAFEKHQNTSRTGAEKRFMGGLSDHSTETTKLHTATHLLHAALRSVLGSHVYQKGSNVTAERLRFDFPHATKMTPEEIKQVEDVVNKAILDDLPVSYIRTTVEDAKKTGAIGVFEDRYGSEVKVYTVGDAKKGVFSREICGGPHVSRTGVLGTFKIQKEESSSAGIRRIKAVIQGGAGAIETATEA